MTFTIIYVTVKKLIGGIPREQRASGIKELDLAKEILPIARALECSGEWNQKNSSFVPHSNAIPLIRRGILASVSSVILRNGSAVFGDW